MHPHTFYSTLFNHAKRDEVFVIMSFAPEFDDRWLRVIEPAIREDLKLLPNRVDYRLSGESIVHDILDGIAHARLVLAEITSSPMRDAQGTVWPQRNGNVMWELGIAHTMRIPDEVLVIRSDNDESIFDLTQFRAFQYDPINPKQARDFIVQLALDRLRSINQAASDYVGRCVQSLDAPCWTMLLHAISVDPFKPPVTRTMGEVLGNLSTKMAIARLLEMGALQTSFVKVTPESVAEIDTRPAEHLIQYHITPIGRAIFQRIGQASGYFEPEVQRALQEIRHQEAENQQQTQ